MFINSGGVYKLIHLLRWTATLGQNLWSDHIADKSTHLINMNLEAVV